MTEESRYVSLAEVKDILKEEAEKRELTYEQSLALSHAEQFVKLNKEETDELIEKLQDEFDFMKEKIAYKTADILPTDADGVLAVFSKDRYTPSKDEIEDITNLIKQYVEG